MSRLNDRCEALSHVGGEANLAATKSRPREHRGWFSSYVACGRVVYPGRARPFASYVCQDALELGGAIKGTGLDRQVKMWTDPECWRVDAKRLGLGPEVDGPLAFRERVGKGLWKTCFQKL